ncbi:MAG: type II secretion system F family protein [Desulfitobacteriaceae bacterium]|nr:type II secretion system F family protein [Clostridia bacterium]MDD4400757.1 type II secretion system F family protein [Desulfitobacteriaceae bacterium]
MLLLLVFSISALVFVLIVTLFYKLAGCYDCKKRRLDSIRQSNKNALDEELEKPFFERVIIPILTSAIKYLSNHLPKGKGDKAQQLARNLKLAGLNYSVNEYNAARLVLSGVFFLTAGLFVLIISPGAAAGFLIFMLSFLLSMIVPIYFIKFRISKRQREVTNQLPDVMDLLSVSIEAGLGFDAALTKIGERLNGILVDELNIVLTEIQLGKPRRIALKNLADRSPVEELGIFISALIQAEQLGIPIKNVLKTQARQLRINRRQKAEEKAMKAPVKMMLPLVIFVLPVLFIILLGPTILQMIEQFGK